MRSELCPAHRVIWPLPSRPRPRPPRVHSPKHSFGRGLWRKEALRPGFTYSGGGGLVRAHTMDLRRPFLCQPCPARQLLSASEIPRERRITVGLRPLNLPERQSGTWRLRRPWRRWRPLRSVAPRPLPPKPGPRFPDWAQRRSALQKCASAPPLCLWPRPPCAAASPAPPPRHPCDGTETEPAAHGHELTTFVPGWLSIQLCPRPWPTCG